MHKTSKLLTCLVFISLLITGCANLKEVGKAMQPEAKINTAKLVNLKADSADIELDLEVFNPNKFSLNLGELNYQLAVENQEFLQGKQSQATSLQAGKTQSIKLPLSLNFNQLAQLVTDLYQRDEINYNLAGGLTYNLPVVGPQTLNFSKGGLLPVPKLPNIEVASVSKQKLDLNGLAMLVNVKVKNPNKFDLNLNQLGYKVKLAGDNLAGGGQIEKLSLEAGKTSELTLPLELKFSPQQAMQLVSQLTKGQGLDYQLELNSQLGSSLPALQALPFTSQKSGKLKF